MENRSPNGSIITLIFALALIIFAVGFRLLPHPENFAPVAAIAIFAGAILPMRWALSLPLAAMIASDLIIGLHSTIFFTWGSFLLIAWLSGRYLNSLKPLNIGIASIGASTLFYLVSNFGVWLEGRLYRHTLDGLINCYYSALPFFKNTLMGDMFYTALIFSLYFAAHKVAISIRNHTKLVSS